MGRRAWMTGLLVWNMAGCDDAVRHATPPVVRDSAAVTIVENSGPAWGAEPRWRLSDEPALSIGEIEGASAHMFHQVMGVARLDDGSIAVAEMGSNQLRLYDPSGRHLWSAGGSGGGPGEIRQVFGLLRGGPDTLLVPDALGSIHLFSTDGSYLRSVEAPLEYGMFARPLAFLLDGSILYEASSPTPVNITAPVEVRATFFRNDPFLGAADSVISLTSVVVHPGWRGESTAATFGPRLNTAVSGDRLYSGYSDEFSIREFDASGTLRRIIRRPWEPAAVTPEMVERYGTSFVDGQTEGGGGVSERLRAQRRSILETQPVAERLPSFTSMLADREGNLWVRETDFEHLLPANGWNAVHPVPSRWSIFDAGGTWLGAVETPANFNVFEIGDDYVAGVGQDDLGVERVLVYELRK